MFSKIYLLILISTFPFLLPAQRNQFKFQDQKVPTGKVFIYEKSNIDGTHKSNIAVYYSHPDTLESLKWTASYAGATLVVASLNWEIFSVNSFDTYQIQESGQRKKVATLRTLEDQQIAVNVPGVFQDTVSLQSFPWQSYDFDFAGLGAIMPHCKNPKKSINIAISDFYLKNGAPNFGEKGMVMLQYLGDEERQGLDCTKYKIDGPGLENKGGLIWFEKSQAYLVAYEIQLPDEPGFKDGKLQLKEVRSLSLQDWKLTLERGKVE